MDYLKIRNWDRWQSYRSDRGQPPWIKIHRCLLRDANWVSLGCQQRGQLVAMWMLAADKNGKIPADPALIQKLCYMDSTPDLIFFCEQGFIEGDAKATPKRRQPDRTDTEAETEKKKTCALSAHNGHKFEDFWKIYPLKRNKKKAHEIWKRKNLDENAEDLISDVAKRILHDKQWKEGFILHCTTYLNGHRWEDSFT